MLLHCPAPVGHTAPEAAHGQDSELRSHRFRNILVHAWSTAVMTYCDQAEDGVSGQRPTLIFHQDRHPHTATSGLGERRASLHHLGSHRSTSYSTVHESLRARIVCSSVWHGCGTSLRLCPVCIARTVRQVTVLAHDMACREPTGSFRLRRSLPTPPGGCGALLDTAAS